MEPQGSLPHSQVPAICPYPEPARSSPYPPDPTSWRSILMLFSHLRLGLPSGFFPQVSPPKTLYTPLLSPTRATCPAHLILLDFITRTILCEQYRSISSSLCSYSVLSLSKIINSYKQTNTVTPKYFTFVQTLSISQFPLDVIDKSRVNSSSN
jgi:hypothetical protein